MTRKCDLSGILPMAGNNVSHAKNRNRRRFLPNLRSMRLRSEVLGEEFQFNIAMATLRTIEHRGGLDQHLMKQASVTLSISANSVKQRIMKANRTSVASSADAPK